MIPSPDRNIPRDDSFSLVLNEQAKALTAVNTAGEDAAADRDIEAEVQKRTGKTTTQLLSEMRDAATMGVTFLETAVRGAWDRSYKAYRNEHFRTSKYLGDRFKSRSKLFKPKTRSAVRKNQASAAGSLFGNADVVTITAQDESDPVQRASAELKKEILNYRLDRANRQTSIPWFLVAMGAHQDAQIAGICCSKQYWKYRERIVDWTNETDEETGETHRLPGQTKVIVDRPDVVNIHPENVIIDPSCEWTDPAQTSGFLIVRYPLPIWDIEKRMTPTQFGGDPEWLKVSREELMAHSGGTPADVAGTRKAREGGNDPTEQSNGVGIWRVLWCQENFVQIDGEDYTFWTLGDEKLLSMPRPTHEAYPHLFGERPYVLGFGALEPHRAIPMSPVESWQQLQQEANEIVNLRLDQMKHVVNPVAKVARGKQVDLNAVQRRSPDGVLLLTDLEKDVAWDRPPDVPASAYAEANYINNDFDELSGSFSTSSVATNRSLNETVGGMKLLSSAATTVTEFDLKVWVETWVDRVLAQVVKLEEFYESDERVLIIAGQKAELYEKFHIQEVTDQLLMQDVTVKVSAGIGAGDPMQKLGKLGTVLQILGQVAQPYMAMGAPVPIPRWDELTNEAFGGAGYKNGFERFFQMPQPQGGPQGPTPQDQVAAAQVQADAQAKERDAQIKGAKVQADAHLKQQDQALADRQQKLELVKEMAEHADRKAERDHKLALEQIKSETQLALAQYREQANQMRQELQLEHDARQASRQRVADASSQTREHGVRREETAAQMKAKAAAAA